MCSHVLNHQREVLLVSRPAGDWCFLCGGVDHEQDATGFFVVGAGHVLQRDDTLEEVLDLGVNEEAERSARGAAWTRSFFSEDED